MISARENEILTRVGPDTPMGRTLRRYWLPVCTSAQLPEPDGRPLRAALLGEAFVAFRDTGGRVGLLDEFCMHRRASLARIVTGPATHSIWFRSKHIPSLAPKTMHCAARCSLAILATIDIKPVAGPTAGKPQKQMAQSTLKGGGGSRSLPTDARDRCGPSKMAPAWPTAKIAVQRDVADTSVRTTATGGHSRPFA